MIMAVKARSILPKMCFFPCLKGNFHTNHWPVGLQFYQCISFFFLPYCEARMHYSVTKMQVLGVLL